MDGKLESVNLLERPATNSHLTENHQVADIQNANLSAKNVAEPHSTDPSQVNGETLQHFPGAVSQDPCISRQTQKTELLQSLSSINNFMSVNQKAINIPVSSIIGDNLCFPVHSSNEKYKEMTNNTQPLQHSDDKFHMPGNSLDLLRKMVGSPSKGPANDESLKNQNLVPYSDTNQMKEKSKTVPDTISLDRVSQRHIKDTFNQEKSLDELRNNNLSASNAQVVNEPALISTNKDNTTAVNTSINQTVSQFYDVSKTHNSSFQDVSRLNNPPFNQITESPLPKEHEGKDNQQKPVSLIISNNNGVLSYQTGIIASGNEDMISKLQKHSREDNDSVTDSSSDIPDLRQQFLQMQNLPLPGQVVILPPLCQDRSIQIFQLLCPTSTGAYNSQTVVLPIMKLDAANSDTNQNVGKSNESAFDPIRNPTSKNLEFHSSDQPIVTNSFAPSSTNSTPNFGSVAGQVAPQLSQQQPYSIGAMAPSNNVPNDVSSMEAPSQNVAHGQQFLSYGQEMKAPTQNVLGPTQQMSKSQMINPVSCDKQGIMNPGGYQPVFTNRSASIQMPVQTSHPYSGFHSTPQQTQVQGSASYAQNVNSPISYLPAAFSPSSCSSEQYPASMYVPNQRILQKHEQTTHQTLNKLPAQTVDQPSVPMPMQPDPVPGQIPYQSAGSVPFQLPVQVAGLVPVQATGSVPGQLPMQPVVPVHGQVHVQSSGQVPMQAPHVQMTYQSSVQVPAQLSVPGSAQDANTVSYPETVQSNLVIGSTISQGPLNGTPVFSLPEAVSYDNISFSSTLNEPGPVVVESEDDEVMLNQLDETGLPKIMQGIDLEKIKKFAADFKTARLALGLTQTQVGQALQTSLGEGVMVSQSTICRFEKLEITATQVKKFLPVLQTWLDNVKSAISKGPPVDLEALKITAPKDANLIKPRKRRTIFPENIVAELNKEFKVDQNPGNQKIATIASQVGLEVEKVRVWFSNRRQTEKKAKKMETHSS